jgi:hypothetical protein
MDGLGVLTRQTLEAKLPSDFAGVSMISVGPADMTGKKSEFLGVAIMDGRWRSDMHFGRPTMFRVDAGEHTVTVHIKRRFRAAGYRGRAIVSVQVVVQPGEHLDLVFGVTAEWKARGISNFDWSVLALAFLLVYTATVGLAYGAGWLAFPVLRDVVARATFVLGIGQPWLSCAYFFVSSPGKTAVFTMLAWVLAASVGLMKSIPTRSPEMASPYFLSRKPVFGKPSPVFKPQYVDPFE